MANFCKYIYRVLFSFELASDDDELSIMMFLLHAQILPNRHDVFTTANIKLITISYIRVKTIHSQDI
jgi:hypothetical protein